MRLPVTEFYFAGILIMSFKILKFVKEVLCEN